MTIIAEHDKLKHIVQDQKLLIEDLRSSAFQHTDAIAELRNALDHQTTVIESLAIELIGADKALETQIKTSNIRRRMNRSVSTKGIIQYDGTIEANGLSREEFEAEQAWMDQLQNRLQPEYEEFVVSLPRPNSQPQSVPANPSLNKP